MPTRTSRRSGWRQRLDTPGWGLLPLRAFLGATFVFAGLQKLADRNFFRASSPSSIQAQLHAYANQSPIGGLLGGATHVAVLLGLFIAVAELAVGAGTLLGLWARPAAVGGALLSLGFLLTVSWQTRPYYYGADIVFLAAFLPLALVGDGGVLSLSAHLRDRERRQLGLPVDGPVSIEFAAVRRLCGAYESGSCQLRHGRACEPTPCPVLRADPRPPTRLVESLDRRAFLATARAAAFVTAGAAGTGVVAATVGRLLPRGSEGLEGRSVSATGLGAPALGDPSKEATTTAPTTRPPTSPGAGSSTTVAVRPRGTVIGAASAVSKGGAASFQDPGSGRPAYVLRSSNGDYRAFSAVCTHAGCTVDYAGSDFSCPCHGARFSTTDGSVTRGPAKRPLAAIPVAVGPDGLLYADS